MYHYVEDKEFLRHFAENMIKDIPKNGSVIVYNRGFEHSRINELAKLYPDLENELIRIKGSFGQDDEGIFYLAKDMLVLPQFSKGDI